MTEQLERQFSLNDRYTLIEGDLLLSGLQAAVRAPMDQLRADKRAGLRTAGLVSGYQGSPLAGYDTELHRQQSICREVGLVHVPAVNEELGATAVMGSQQVSVFSSARYEGVLGVWYGKAPGFDRAADAIRHANWAGTARTGGVLALVGDDHECKSSTLPSRSEATIAAVGLPVLTPATPQDVLDLALHGFAMSRVSGSWIAMKIATQVADGTGVVHADPERVRPELPDLSGWSPTVSAMLVPPASLQREAEMESRRDAISAYLELNPGINRVHDVADAWLTIIAAGHTSVDVIAALRTLGLDERGLRGAGVRVVRLGCVHPLDVALIRKVCAGVDTVLVVEDKLSFLEIAVRDTLYGQAHRPRVVGKLDADGQTLIPATGASSSSNLVAPLRRVLATRLGEDNLAPERRSDPITLAISPVRPESVRTPFFCSGCPHNTSLQVPAGAKVGLGIGCHGMATYADPARVGELTGITQMGGEGAQWLGIAPFVDDTHLFQNMGDGTFFHSGQLAIQAAVAAGAHVTFKLLYNDAVAMTGGQTASGLLSVEAIAGKLLSEGVSRIIITTEDVGRYRRRRLPAGVEVRDRTAVVEAQEELRDAPGVTVLIHDQQCAAELRRDRKRGRVEDPGFRIVINDRVCEGCGDCGGKSSCLSLTPIDTEWGRKTQVDQSSCNLDTTCLAGDCPAFVKIRPPQRVSTAPPQPPVALPEPTPTAQDANIRLPGIGGTGVITVSQILATAALLDGRAARTLDQTGLSQKAGPVVSTLSIGDPAAGVDLVLACDLVVATTRANLEGIGDRPAIVVASTTATPTARMIGKPTSAVEIDRLRSELDDRTTQSRNVFVDAGAITTGLFGDATTSNVFLAGIAHQMGAIPISGAAIERAIEMNGTAVATNHAAFRWGRAWVIDPDCVVSASGFGRISAAATSSSGIAIDDLLDDPELHRIAAVRVADLVDYQGKRLARRYIGLVRAAQAADRRAGGDGRFSRTVAIQLHRVMAYKDEYEVARLLLADRANIEQRFGRGTRVNWQLHPPLLKAMGLDHKISFGSWAAPALSLLRRARHLRGTPFDPFGPTGVRRAERALRADYERLVTDAIILLDGDYEKCVRLVGLVEMVKGYEDVKMTSLARYRELLAAAEAETTQ